MVMIKRVVILLQVFLVSNMYADFPYRELVPGFKRTDSKIMARKIKRATLANLDMAAYDKNPLLLERSKIKLPKKEMSVELDTLTFSGAVSNVVNDISRTPLSEKEQNTPLAWQPLLKRLWSVVKDDNLGKLSSKIAAHKWDNPEIYQPFQEISTLYFHQGGKGKQLWVKIEFAIWVPYLDNINDSDNDGVRELFAKLSLQDMHDDSLGKIVDWVENRYCKETLNQEEARVWVTELVSYWYPSLNTDLADIGDENVWPDKKVNRKIRKELKGQTFKNPFAVIEGKPYDPKKPVYNVFILDTDSVKTDQLVDLKKSGRDDITEYDSTVSENFKNNMIRFDQELSVYGSYDEWNGKKSSFIEGVRKWIGRYPKEQMGLVGKDGWLFFRRSAEVLTKTDSQMQSRISEAVDHITGFKKYLEKKGVNFLFVLIPDKEMVYFDKLSDEIPLPKIDLISTYQRELQKRLQESGVEIIDLLPEFLEAKEEDSSHNEFLYQKNDTHWSNRGIMITAELISKRIREYSWYEKEEKTDYFTTDTLFERSGDIVERLPDDIRNQYHPYQVLARQVFDVTDKILFKSDRFAPVMLVGDSFTGAFETVDCKGAGVGAHIAAKVRMPIDIITSWGGGPLVPNKALRMRQDEIQSKHLVIYLMVSRDIFNYSLEWEPLSVPK